MAGFADVRPFPDLLRDNGDYSYSINYRGFTLAAIITGVGALALLVCFVAGNDLIQSTKMDFAKIVRLFLWVGIVAACLYRLRLLREPWLIVYPDWLEKRELGGWRTLYRADIEGTRTAGSGRSGSWFEVVTCRADGVTARLQFGFRGIIVKTLLGKRQRERRKAGEPLWNEGAC